MKEKLVFVTNDDGYNSRGIQALLEVARKFGRVVAIAPETPQSGMSQAITINNPLFLREVSKGDGVEVYAFSGTPVDCVKIAFDYLLQNGETPDLVLSGINHGANSAVNVLYSGTMGAAIEGSFYNIPSIGFSLLDHDEDADFGTVQQYILPIVRKAMTENLGRPLCLNVNVPNLPAEQIRGIMPCRQNRGYWREVFERRQDPRGHDYYWLCGYFENTEPEATDTDEWALKNGYVSVVPIQVDLTNYEQLGQLKELKFE